MESRIPKQHLDAIFREIASTGSGNGLEMLDNLAMVISEHMFKLCLVPGHGSAGHWRQELSGWRKLLTRCNQSDKLGFKAATLKKYLFSEPLGTLKDLETLKKMVEKEYGIKISLDNAHRKLEAYADNYIQAILNNEDV